MDDLFKFIHSAMETSKEDGLNTDIFFEDQSMLKLKCL